MAVNLYNGFTNKITGETFRCISCTEDSISFEWIVEPGGYVPFEHTHLKQDEIFHVKKGELKLVIDGEECIIGEGQSLTVPKGAPHIAYNNKPELLSCIIDYVPALDTYRFFQCFGGLTMDLDMNKNGTINIPKMLYFSRKMNARCVTRPTKIPSFLFWVVNQLCFITGTLLGWIKYYTKYTSDKQVKSTTAFKQV